MGADLNSFTVPANPHDQGGEYFEPVNAWTDAPQRIFLTVVGISRGTVIQIGVDADSGLNPALWMRQKLTVGGDWGAWQNIDLVPPPPVGPKGK